MAGVTGHRVEQVLHQGTRSTVFRATRLEDGAAVIVKALTDELPQPRHVAALRKEYEVLRHLADHGVEGVPHPLALLDDGGAAMVLEYLPGRSLQEHIGGHPLPVKQALRVGAALARILGRVHAAGIVQRDVKPSNVVIDPSTERVWLIDFGIATALEAVDAAGQRLQGSIAYMSPEQTGRMNRPVDYRTDFYALGATLYQALTGRLPFELDDPLELVHAHIALEPTPASQVRPDLPAPLSALVARLLAKNPEDRYQSASGLANDLDAMLAAILEGTLSDAFALGARDVPVRFSLPTRLYGREDELGTLLAAFERVGRKGSEVLLVSGFSGIGKSALIHEVHKPTAASRGYFISGKFDQFKRNIPYASIIQAFGDLVAQLLTESADRIEKWRGLVLDALGGIAGVATEVLPELEHIIGAQPVPPELTGEAAQNRLNRAFLQLVRVFAQRTHPLVLFLDDLQWADRPTLNLLRILVTDDDLGHLMVIGCYRNNEVDASHPLALTLDAMRRQRADAGLTPIGAVQLDGLDVATLARLVADCVHTTPERAAPLAQLIHGKTLGNPFFVGQFLRLLHQDGLLRREEGRWIYDLEEIEARDITDNVVTLLTGKLEQLGGPTLRVLRLAAAVGNVFELRTLAAVSEGTPDVVADQLWDALAEGYLVPLDDGYRLVGTPRTAHSASPSPSTPDAGLNPRYRFLHDRVQQAAYALIPEAERAGTHLRIGRALRARHDDEALEDRLFDVADQLGHGLALIRDPVERVAVARVFARAGTKARLASAHEPALKYFAGAQALLGDELWTTHYEIGQPVVFQRSESEYLLANFDTAEGLFDELVERSRTDLEKARVYRLKLGLYQSRGLFLETVDIAYRGLSHLGVELPRDPSQLTFLSKLVPFKLKMRGRTEADLKALPVCTDPVVVTALDIMNDFSGPAFFVDINIYLCVVLTMCSLSLEHGNAAESAYCWTLYGMMNGPIMGNVPHGMELGRVGEHIDQQHGRASLIPKVALSLGGLVYQWGQHPRLSIPYFERGFHAALESGDPTHAGYCANFMVCMFSVLGEPLPLIEETTTRFLDFARKNQIEVQSEIQVVERQMARCLMGGTASPVSWDDDGFDEATWLAQARGFQSRQPLHNYLIEKQLTLVLAGEPELAVGFGEEAATMLDVSLGIPISSNFHLFYGLANAMLAGQSGRRQARGRLRKMVKQHRKWARHNPDGFEHKRLLLEAELARVQGEGDRAERLYEQSIEQASAQRFSSHEAIALERQGRHLIERGKPRLARGCLREARHAYQRWGAHAVVARLEAEFPDLAFAATAALRQSRTTTAMTQTATGTVAHDGNTIDLDTVLRASRALSSEIVLARLLEQLMGLVLENAGARRAVLILDKSGQRLVEAEQRAGEEPRVMLGQPLTERDDLAHGVLLYVDRTREPIVLDDLSSPGAFARDPYIASGATRSLLCAPIEHGGLVVGFLYLENDLVTGAFTPERTELLRMLSSQIAISIENASHYRRAEEQAAAFARFVPKQFLEYLGHEELVDVRLGDAVHREMTVLFSDIRSFTAMSEGMSPSENMAFLNEYLQRVGPVMREHRGFIDKYIGDAVMALFPRSPDDAIRAAIAMHRQVAALNELRVASGREPIAIGVGLHHGGLMLGTIGEAERMDTTVISDAVNTASRLEGLTKAYGSPILVTGTTLDQCADRATIRHRWLGDVRPRGRESVVALYEVYEPLPEAQAALRDATRQAMEDAVRAYLDGDTEAARQGFAEVLEQDPDDPAAAAFLACANGEANGGVGHQGLSPALLGKPPRRAGCRRPHPPPENE